MSLLVRSPVEPDDDLDTLLRAYFRAEMPDPWPSWEAPLGQPAVVPLRPESGRRPLSRSRIALAASVALLVAGPLLLSGKFTDQPAKPADANFKDTSADTRGRLGSRYKMRNELSVEKDETFDKIIIDDLPAAPGR